MPSAAESAEGTKGDEVERDYSPETITALFRALEAAEADVSPELAWTVQATIDCSTQVVGQLEKDSTDPLS